MNAKVAFKNTDDTDLTDYHGFYRLNRSFSLFSLRRFFSLHRSLAKSFLWTRIELIITDYLFLHIRWSRLLSLKSLHHSIAFELLTSNAKRQTVNAEVARSLKSLPRQNLPVPLSPCPIFIVLWSKILVACSPSPLHSPCPFKEVTHPFQNPLYLCAL